MASYSFQGDIYNCYSIIAVGSRKTPARLLAESCSGSIVSHCR